MTVQPCAFYFQISGNSGVAFAWMVASLLFLLEKHNDDAGIFYFLFFVIISEWDLLSFSDPGSIAFIKVKNPSNSKFSVPSLCSCAPSPSCRSSRNRWRGFCRRCLWVYRVSYTPCAHRRRAPRPRAPVPSQKTLPAVSSGTTGPWPSWRNTPRCSYCEWLKKERRLLWSNGSPNELLTQYPLKHLYI